MRKTYTETYGSESEGELGNEKRFIESIRDGSSDINSLLFGRVNEYCGIIQGWVPNDTDPIYKLENNSFTENGILLADKFSNLITQKEAFYNLYNPPRGPGGIAPWLFKFLFDYALGKGLDRIIDILKAKDSQDLGKEISIDWGKDNGDSLGEIEITFSNGHKLIIEAYPNNIERITVRQKKMIEMALKKEKETIIIYDAWGRVTASQKDSSGYSIDIDV